LIFDHNGSTIKKLGLSQFDIVKYKNEGETSPTPSPPFSRKLRGAACSELDPFLDDKKLYQSVLATLDSKKSVKKLQININGFLTESAVQGS